MKANHNIILNRFLDEGCAIDPDFESHTGSCMMYMVKAQSIHLTLLQCSTLVSQYVRIRYCRVPEIFYGSGGINRCHEHF